MSLLASVLPSRNTNVLRKDPASSQAESASSRFLNPSLKLNDDGLDTLKFQQGNNEAKNSQSESSRFFLPMMLDSVNEVSYKISVPNFSSLPPLRMGAKYISNMIKIDSMTPGDIYGPNNLNKNSGLDNYYFNLEEGLGSFSRFEKVSQLDLPDRFFDEYNMTECSTKMGLFSQISRAWISVDNKLVFWNYKLPQSSFNKAYQFFTMDQIRHSILMVDLVKPKNGVFVDDANYLLLIATTMDVQIYVVKYNSATNELDMFNPNLSVSTQGLIVSHFAVNELTNDIYFSSEGDGVNVWRLDYSNNVSFKKNRCDKVCLTKSGLSSVLPISKISGFDIFMPETENHKTIKAHTNPKAASIPETVIQMEVDSKRSILYTLSNKSVIRVYKLQPNQEQFSQHSQLSPNELFKSLSQLIPSSANIKSFSKFKIVSIHSISEEESSNVQLIATTNYGNRIYFKLGSNTSFTSFMSSASRYSSFIKLSVISMRFCPAKEEPKLNPELDSFLRIKQYVDQMASAQQQSELLKNTKFAKIISPGVFLAVKKTKGSDKLFIASVNYGFLKHNNKLVEDAEFIPISSPGNQADNSPIVIHDIIQITPSMNATNTPNGYANVLASQYSKKPLEFAVLTNFGITVYRYRTSSQIISSLDNKIMETFIEENGFEETCSSLLYLACSLGNQTSDESFVRKVEFLFSHAGNNARLIESSSTAHNQSHLPIQSSDSQPVVEQVVLSDRFYGTCLLISRLFRESWSLKVFECLPHIKILPSGSVEIVSIKEDNLLIKGLTITRQQVEYFMGSLIVLLDFFNNNKSRIPGLNAPSYSSDPSKFENEVCSRAEHIAFSSLVRSLESMKEALSFLMVLIEESSANSSNKSDIFKFLSVTNQINLLTLTLKDILLPTSEVKNLIKDLLSSIINKTILKGGSIDLIASSLQGRCGSFCSSDDVYIFKAIENLTRAKQINSRDNELKVHCLRTAVNLFEQASDSLTFENIENSIDIMLSLDYYAGAVEFLLKIAKRLGGAPTAEPHIIMSHEVQSETSQLKYKQEQRNKRRANLFDLVFKILTKLDIKAIQVSESGNQLLINEFAELRDATYDTCFASTEKSFHFDFYRWFINQGCSDRLLTVETPFVLPFLEEACKNDLALTELLWLYHAKRENFYQAAKILYTLATSEFSLSLEQRTEYLSRANGFCNCACPPALRQEMVQLSAVIRDLFEVANVQLDLLATIKSDPRINEENQKIAHEALNFKIQNVSDLFNGYADPLGYYEICFSIFCISDYKNPDDILKRWELFFEKIYHKSVSRHEDAGTVALALSDALIAIGTKIHGHDVVFPVEKLIKLFCKYTHLASSENEADQPSVRGIVVDTFTKCGVPYETMYVTIRGLIEHNSNDMYSGFIGFLEKTEMICLIQNWYQKDKTLRDAIPSEKIMNMKAYSTKDDPIEQWLKTRKMFL